MTKIPTGFDLRIPACAELVCIMYCIRRRQIQKIKNHIRLMQKPATKLWLKRKNSRHGGKDYRKRKKLEKLQSDPEYAKVVQQRAHDNFQSHKDRIYEYRKHRRKTDPQFQISCNLRTYIFQRVGAKTTSGQSRFASIVGCPIEVFCQWLEAHFEPWMDWSKYGKGLGKWVIDHYIPCSAFDLTKEEEVKKCFHYSNMFPLCWRGNLAKGDKLPHEL